jgi:hypothetical protein
MPTTEYNVLRIKDRVGQYSPQQILDVLDEIQLIVYSQDCDQTQKIDPATGLPPFIHTNSGVYHYNCPSDCRRTAAIFSQSLPKSYSRTRPVGPRREYYFRNRGYNLIAASSRDATPSDRATVDFQDDPGHSHDQYYHLYYIQPPRLTDISIQLTIPDHLHFYLRRAVLAMLSTESHGETGMDDAVIEEIARKIRNQLNGGFQAMAGRTPIPEELQDYPESSYDNWM